MVSIVVHMFEQHVIGSTTISLYDPVRQLYILNPVLKLGMVQEQEKEAVIHQDPLPPVLAHHAS